MQHAMIGAITILLFSVSAGQAREAPTLLCELVGTSELIVLGEVTRVSEKTFTLHVERVIVGKYKSEVMEIVRFADWACAWRYAPYEIGQRGIVFVNQCTGDIHTNEPPLLELGEWPVVANSVYPMTTVTADKHPEEQIGKLRVTRFDLAQVISAIEGYRRWFQFSMREGRFVELDQGVVFTSISSVKRFEGPLVVPGKDRRFSDRQSRVPRTLVEYMRQSGIHRYLVESTEAFAEGLAQAKE